MINRIKTQFKVLLEFDRDRLAYTTEKMLKKVSLTLAYWLGLVFCCLACRVIKTYHLSKPLGMQTLLGKFIVLFTNVYLWSVACYAFAFTIGITCSPSGFVNNFTARIITVVIFMASQACFSAFTICLIVKYFSIYHSTWLESVDEDQLISKARISLVVGPSVMAFVEYCYLTRILDNRYYQFFRYGTNGGEGVETLRPVLLLITFLCIAILQTRLELDNLHFGEDSLLLNLLRKLNCLGQNSSRARLEEDSNVTDGYNMGVFRMLFILGVSIFSLFLYMVIIDTGDLANIVLPGFFIISTLIPAVFIANHPKLKKLALTQVRRVPILLLTCYR